MARVLFGLTGSVASIKAVEVARALSGAGHTVRLAMTRSARYFLSPDDWNALGALCDGLFQDSDEWPGERYQRGQAIAHIALRDWCDLLLIAPLDAHSLAKTANGLADNLLTSILRAWNFARPMVLAPAMNTQMWHHPVTAKHLGELAGFFGVSEELPRWNSDDPAQSMESLVQSIHAATGRLRLVAPIKKVLACGDEGVGAMADPREIATAVSEMAKKLAHPKTAPE